MGVRPQTRPHTRPGGLTGAIHIYVTFRNLKKELFRRVLRARQAS